MVMMVQTRNYVTIPGWKLCRHCYDEVKHIYKEESSGENHDDSIAIAGPPQREEKKDQLDESLGIFGNSPVKTHGWIRRRIYKKKKTIINLNKHERSYEKQKEVAADLHRCPSRP